MSDSLRNISRNKIITFKIFGIPHLFSLISLILFSVLFSSVAIAQQQEVVLTTGSSWVIPPDADLSSITVECWGAGGGGAYTSGSKKAGGGAGGGAYAKKGFTSFTAGQAINYAIGDGGSGASGTHAGGDTWFFANDPTGVMAKGGEGAVNNSENGAVGGAASSSIGDVKHNGGNGGKGSYTSGSICGDELASGGGGAAATPGSTGASGGNGDTETGNLFCSGNHATGGSGGSNLLFTGYTSKGGNGVGQNRDDDPGKNGLVGTNGGGGSGAVMDTYNGGNGGNGLIRITYMKTCITYSTDTHVACETFDWIDGDGNTYTSSNNTATHTLVGQNENGCDSIITLDLTINHSSSGDTAATACNEFIWYGDTYSTSGHPTHTLTNAGGCDSVVTLDLTINNTPTTGDTSAIACEEFTWYGTTYTTSGNPTHTLTNEAGCDSTVILVLTINDSSTGDTAATACNEFIWYGNTYSTSGYPTHTLTNAAGCDSVVTLDLTINTPTTGDTSAIACEEFTWYGTTYTTSGNPTHTLTSLAGCDSVVTLDLTIQSLPPIHATSNSSICEGEVLKLYVTDVNGATYEWSGPNGFTSQNKNPTINTTGSSNTGVYEVIASIGNDCTETTQVNVTVHPLPVLTLSAIDDSCSYGVGQITVSTVSPNAPLTYSWNNGSTDSLLTELSEGTFEVTVTDTASCSTTHSIKIHNNEGNCGCFVYVANAFTPNGDGNNDLLPVHGSCITHLTFKIFNQWGNLVFETDQLNDGWDGIYIGKLQNSGIFVYSLETTFNTGETTKESGNINLIR